MYPRRPKAEALVNAVDVVERLRDPNDPSTEHMAPPRSAHVHLDDVPRALDPVEDDGVFRQHDGVVTILMNYSSRASPKLCYSIIEEYGGRGHRTRLRNRSRGSTCVNLCV